jgi:hypothetical protein
MTKIEHKKIEREVLEKTGSPSPDSSGIPFWLFLPKKIQRIAGLASNKLKK